LSLQAREKAPAKLRELSQPAGGILGTSSRRSVGVTDLGGGLIQLAPSEPAITQRIRQAVGRSIEIIERRVNALGTVERGRLPRRVPRALLVSAHEATVANHIGGHDGCEPSLYTLVGQGMP
jgi:hypothetical protein